MLTRLWKAVASRLAPERDFRRDLFLKLAMSSIVSVWLRRRLLRRWGADVGEQAYVQPRSFFYSPNFELGDGCFLNYQCYIDTYARVTIGSNVWVGPRVTILTATHMLGEPPQRAGTPTGKPVAIGDGCWIAARAAILPGVTIGPGCVIAAGAVVTKDCEPDGLYAGNPAERVRDL